MKDVKGIHISEVEVSLKSRQIRDRKRLEGYKSRCWRLESTSLTGP